MSALMDMTRLFQKSWTAKRATVWPRRPAPPRLGASARLLRWIAATTMITLTACGVDGPPVPPEPAPKPGVSITGSAEIGIVGG